MTEQSPPSSQSPALVFPSVLKRFEETYPDAEDLLPRRITRRFHGYDITGWCGKVHFSDIQGYVENKRLKIYLNRWRNRRGEIDAIPSTQEMYEIMLEADSEIEQEEQRPFSIKRLAKNLIRNGVQEEIIVQVDTNGKTWLWDGNRRFFSTYHIQHSEEHREAREPLQWIPAFVIQSSGDPIIDKRLKHSILTETNFVTKDVIPWPTFIKAEEIWNQFTILIKADPNDPVLRRMMEDKLASEYGVLSKGKPDHRKIARWIKMVDLAREFKEYHEEEKSRDEDAVDLHVAEYFEYFDELTKPKVAAVLADPINRDTVFDWLWDDKLPSFQAVRKIPAIFLDPVALHHMQTDSEKTAFTAAETALAANDPAYRKDTRAAAAKIFQFSDWLSSFKLEDYRQLDAESLKRLKSILDDIVKMLEGLMVKADAPPQSNDNVAS